METKTYSGQSLINKLRHFIKNQNVQVITLVIFVILDTVLISNIFFSSKKVEEDFFNYDDSGFDSLLPSTGLSPRALDGLLVSSEATSSRPIAVIIENHFDAWPQSGVSDANLVYEFLTEGGITRFLAFFDPASLAPNIGPVRSCRPYFLNVAEELEAVLSHVGGSPDCLDLLKRRQYNVYDLDEYSKGDYFFRSKIKNPPHNVYTSTELITKYLGEKDIPSEHQFENWKYKDDSPTTSTAASQILVDFSTYTYNVAWQYDEKNNDYRRFVTDEPHKDSNSEEIRAKNIVVQRVKARLLDSVGRLALTMEGRGDAMVFLDGDAIEGYWKKPDRNSRTRFYSMDGQEIAFNRGTTWVEILPTDREVNYE
ncbi:DUF3048 domain-containing protein [Candidatus Falkowbacteria bacterium]|nr:DUF3048 domain-containing protein [Candidatus Falkowbacteria bacterium]